jgi:hypothetical protein
MDNNFHLTAITFLEKELSLLEARRAALVAEIDVEIDKRRKLIEGHRELARESDSANTSAATAEPSGHLAEQPQEPTIPRNAFKNISIIAGIKKYLKMAQTGKSTRQIADAFIKGGMKKSTDKYLLDTIRTALRRRGEKNGIVKIEDLWWLAEWPHTPKTHGAGVTRDNSSQVDIESENDSDSGMPDSTGRLTGNNGRESTPAITLSAFDEAGKPMSKMQRIKNIVPFVEGDEVSQPLVMAKVRELCPDLIYTDPTIVTKALRELEEEGVLVEVQKARAKNPAVFRKVSSLEKGKQ